MSLPRASGNVVAQLMSELGDSVSIDDHSLSAVCRDRSGWDSATSPLALVTARSVSEVQFVMRLASKFRIPVVPRGAGTGLAGGAVATKGAIVLSTSALCRIIEIAPTDQLAVVESGVINQSLSDAAASHGLTFSPDPASKAISTIGGNIATNAGGLLCAKYGVTRDAVLGLAVVLADGRLLRTGRRSVKGVTGYDLTALFTGSEGTLGVIVEATVALRPLPSGGVVTIGAFFDTVSAAAAASALVTAARLRPAVMELMDGGALLAVDSYNGTDLASRGSAYLLVQTDGGLAESEAEQINHLLRGAGGTVEISANLADGEALLATRRSFHPALLALGEVLIEDVCVPRSQLAAMFDAITQIGARHGLSIPTVAHAGDGNLHPNFMLPAGSRGVPQQVWDAADELFTAALALGGTLTGEHGVGVLKKRWLKAEIGTDSYELQRGIKAVFDPLGIMNPGKVFE